MERRRSSDGEMTYDSKAIAREAKIEAMDKSEDKFTEVLLAEQARK